MNQQPPISGDIEPEENHSGPRMAGYLAVHFPDMTQFPADLFASDNTIGLNCADSQEPALTPDLMAHIYQQALAARVSPLEVLFSFMREHQALCGPLNISEADKQYLRSLLDDPAID